MHLLIPIVLHNYDLSEAGFIQRGTIRLFYIEYRFIVLKTELMFNVPPGPHEVGKPIEMDCSINRSKGMPSKFEFYISVLTINSKRITVQAKRSSDESHIRLHGIVNPSLEYNGGRAICKFSNKTDVFEEKTVTLHIYRRLY